MVTGPRIGAALLAPLLLVSACTTQVAVEVTPPAGHTEEQVSRDSEECDKEGRAKMSAGAPVLAWFATKLGAAATGAAVGAALGLSMIAGGSAGTSPSAEHIGIVIGASIALGLLVGSVVGTVKGFKEARVSTAEEREAGRNAYADCLRARGYAVAPPH